MISAPFFVFNYLVKKECLMYTVEFFFFHDDVDMMCKFFDDDELRFYRRLKRQTATIRRKSFLPFFEFRQKEIVNKNVASYDSVVSEKFSPEIKGFFFVYASEIPQMLFRVSLVMLQMIVKSLRFNGSGCEIS